MKKLYLYHFGIGNVGKKLIEFILAHKKRLQDKYHVELIYCAGFVSRGGVFVREGFSDEQLLELSHINKDTDLSLQFKQQFLADATELYQYFSPSAVIIDTTASDMMQSLLLQGLRNKAFAVLSNKKPLTTAWEEYEKLTASAHGRIFYETTVGAGLPIVQTMQSLLDSGDEIVEIQGCLSGTLGYIFSQLERRVAFSKTVREAKQKGFTEPDPRDDLSGLDVARKALILARILDQKINLEDVEVECLFPKSMETLSSKDFMDGLEELDGQFVLKQQRARKKNATLRYVASVTPNGCKVGVKEIPEDSELGNLNGPDNLIIFKSKRYHENPLVIKGPGAGIEVTAAGVLADIVKIVHKMAH